MIAIAAQPHLVTLAAPAQPAAFVVLDLETGDAPEQDILDAISAWKGQSNWKPETVDAKREEAAQKIRDKAALLDSSPVLCVGARTDREAVMFAGMGGTGLVIDGWRVEQRADEKGMLIALADWLNAHTDGSTALAGHNVRGFDLPKLRGAYVRNRLPLPDCLKPREGQPGQPVTDTMHLFKHFSMEHRDNPFVSLDTVARAFGVPRPKEVISGADVPRLHRDGQGDVICTYCAIDVDTTAEIYRLMMS